MPNLGSAVEFISRAVPFDPPEGFVSALKPRLEAAMIFVPPLSFAKSAIAVALLPILVEAGALMELPPETSLPVVAIASVLQCSPFLALLYSTGRRRRLAEGELPFVAMLLFILSHESFANLPDAFKRLEQLGPEVFPAFFAEAQNLGRNLAYGTGSSLNIVEETFKSHPSAHVRELVHGYLTTLYTGRDVHEFLREESTRLLTMQEDRWRSFSGLLSTITEVSFIFLAVFPVGIQMIAGTFSEGSSSLLLLVSLGVLCLVALALLVWMDLVQPVSHDVSYPPALPVGSLSSLSVVVGLYYFGVLDSFEAAVLSFLTSSLYVMYTRGFFATLRAGEPEASRMLHDLAELVRAGVEMPSAISRLLEGAGRCSSVQTDLSRFSRMLALGRSPVAAQKKVTHPSWIVRVSFALLALSFETGGGYEQLEKLSLSFRKVADSRRSIRAYVLPFAFLGTSVPFISSSSFWFLRSIQSLGTGIPLLTAQAGGLGAAGSILATSILAGVMVSKAYSLSLRSLMGLPPLLASVMVSFLIFGSP